MEFQIENCWTEIVLAPTTKHTKITLTGTGLQQSQAQDITISVITTVNVDARTVRRRVAAWLVSEVGNMLVGRIPQLVISREILWRVPVLLTSSVTGTVGEVGTVDVDAESGELFVSEALRDQILANVQHLTRPTLSPAR